MIFIVSLIFIYIFLFGLVASGLFIIWCLKGMCIRSTILSRMCVDIIISLIISLFAIYFIKNVIINAS